jgi:tRNA uridine 5-carbamoylmethylation protein Kti12
MRHELFKIALENGCAFTVVYVSTPVDVALRWNNERPDSRIPDLVIERINERFDLPGRRYLWDDSMIEVNMEGNDVDAIAVEIAERIQNLEVATEPKQDLVTTTEFERLDVETRRAVSEFLKKHPHLRGMRKVSEIRRSVLKQATQGKTLTSSVYELLMEQLKTLL